MSVDNASSFVSHERKKTPSLICGIPNPFSEQNMERHDDFSENQGKEDVDTLLAASMNNLSFQDRERVLEEIHGVAKADPEDETSLTSKLMALEGHLSAKKKGFAYELAEKVNPTYTANRDLRMMFLRSNDYNPVAAAEQMLKFFDIKQSLFGTDKLSQQITIDDLDDGVKRCLQAGYAQFMEPKDAVSRQMLLFLPGLKVPEADVETEARALFYFLLSAVEAHETQKRGLIVVFFAIGNFRDAKKSAGAGKLTTLTMAMPLRFCSIHMCCSDPVEYVMNRAVIRLLPASTAAKIRIHLGTHMECQYALRAYGIPSEILPISPVDLLPDLTNHRKWYQRRMQLEKEWKQLQSNGQGVSSVKGGSVTGSPSKRVEDDVQDHNISPHHHGELKAAIQPQPTDVLFGRGSLMHPGNVRFRQMVTENSQSYELARGKQQKIHASGQLLDALKRNGVRFLVYDKEAGQWKTATNAQARNKIAKTIRNRRRTQVATLW